MKDESQLILVDVNAVPTVFLKVLEAKQLLAKGIVRSSTEACKEADISRSAFYKYKDSVFMYDEDNSKKTITIYLKLSDTPGVLSSVLSQLYTHKANVLTVNQNLPIEGVADVTVTIKIDKNQSNMTNLKTDLGNLEGVLEIKKV